MTLLLLDHLLKPQHLFLFEILEVHAPIYAILVQQELELLLEDPSALVLSISALTSFHEYVKHLVSLEELFLQRMTVLDETLHSSLLLLGLGTVEPHVSDLLLSRLGGDP